MLWLFLVFSCTPPPPTGVRELAREIYEAAAISPAVLQCGALAGRARSLCSDVPISSRAPAKLLQAGLLGARRRGLRFDSAEDYQHTLCSTVDQLRARVQRRRRHATSDQLPAGSPDPPPNALLCLALADGTSDLKWYMRKRKPKLSPDQDLVWLAVSGGRYAHNRGGDERSDPDTTPAQAAMATLLPLVWQHALSKLGQVDGSHPPVGPAEDRTPDHTPDHTAVVPTGVADPLVHSGLGLANDLHDLPGYLRTGHATSEIADRILYDGVAPAVILLHRPALDLMTDSTLSWSVAASCTDPRWPRESRLVVIRPDVVQLDHATQLQVDAAPTLPRSPTPAQLRSCYDGVRMQISLDTGSTHDLWLYPGSPGTCSGRWGRRKADQLDVMSNQARYAMRGLPFSDFESMDDNKFENLGEARTRAAAH